MLPILPAILLLLLHGPSNLERLSREGRLPAGLEAMHREMAQAAPPQRRAAIVAMMTGHDPCLAQALIGLLKSDEPEPTAPVGAPPASPAAPVAPTEKPLTEGFADCRRSRDGPHGIA